MHLQGAGPASGCALLLHFTDVGELHNHRLQAHTAARHAFHSLLSASLCDQYISCTTDPQCIAPTQTSRYMKEANANMSVQHAVLGSGKPYTPTLVLCAKLALYDKPIERASDLAWDLHSLQSCVPGQKKGMRCASRTGLKVAASSQRC
jgi:hypothetical protein